MRYKESEFNLMFLDETGKHIYYNTFSGALVRLNQPIYQYIVEDQSDSDEYKKLISLGFLIPEKQDEINKFVIERKKAEFGTVKKLSRFVVAPTLACQAKCIYCFQAGINRNSSHMSGETADEVIHYITDEIIKMNTPKVIVTFFGGEPLLQIERIIQIGQSLKIWCAQHEIEFHSELITNGILLDKELALKLKQCVNLYFAQITLDGRREAYATIKGIDKYDKVVNNIKNICDFLKIIIRVNVTRSNVEEIKELLKELLISEKLDGKLKVTLARVQDYFGCDFNESDCLTPSEFAQFRAEVYLDSTYRYQSLLKRDLLPEIRRCYCGMENCMTSTIGPEGELYKCEHYFGVNDQIIGTVQEGRYYNEAELSFYGELDPKCISSRCPILPTCVGGCQSERVQFGVPKDCENRIDEFIQNLKTYIKL